LETTASGARGELQRRLLVSQAVEGHLWQACWLWSWSGLVIRYVG
jgi:hypothetical protein